MKVKPAANTTYEKGKALVCWIARQELVSIIVLGLIAGGIWGFVEIADEVTEGDTHEIDQAILLALRNPADQADPLGPHWVEELGRDMTALGGMGFLILLTLAVAAYLLLIKKPRWMLTLLAATAGGIVISLLLKQGFDRPRPELVPHGSYVYTSSFPSGHSMMAAVTYLTLGVLLAQVQATRTLRVYVVALAIILTLLVGVSRVYLGVHWPSDVLGGWTLGAVWAFICWLGARYLRSEKAVEDVPDEDPPPFEERAEE